TLKVISLSPELFFDRRGSRVLARPMKGTIKRGRWTAEDEALAKSLAASSKDRAENVMIVDLIRNDLGKVAVPGQVNVSRLYDVEQYPTLWQMTSTVEATLRPDVGLADLLAALFPCGSVTGAPKVSTMRIIRDLEPFPRGIYTGAIGLIRPGGDCTFNVAIRTLLLDSSTGDVTFGVGGGVTIDSTADREYDECLLKSSFLNAPQQPFRLLESILLEDGEFFLLDLHLKRLHDSASYFGFRHQRSEVLEKLERLRLEHSIGRWKVRLLLSKEGELMSEVLALQADDSQPLRVGLASDPIQSNHRFLFHKTTNRAVYEQALRARPDCDDVLLWNERGEITEATIANLVLPHGEDLWTPVLSSGLLPGVFREELLAKGKIRERVIRVQELQEAESFFLINSVQKWRKAELVSGPGLSATERLTT
ncbi:MAG TPA: chorismate-binding protein, partial [Pyrinomonadaceae bacterium]|nr:chorismate-binding protein [Pyrinomonadaceae bacterium]